MVVGASMAEGILLAKKKTSSPTGLFLHWIKPLNQEIILIGDINLRNGLNAAHRKQRFLVCKNAAH